MPRDKRIDNALRGVDYYRDMRDRLDKLSRTRALTEAESIQLERAIYHAG